MSVLVSPKMKAYPSWSCQPCGHKHGKRKFKFPEDPDHIYNQAKAQGVEPEDFGIPNPLEKEYHQYSKEELVEIIIDLKNKIKNKKLLDAFNDDFDYE